MILMVMVLLVVVVVVVGLRIRIRIMRTMRGSKCEESVKLKKLKTPVDYLESTHKNYC